ncbi:MAG: HAMP domain-containing histidine kinase [Calditrichaeota bacterium]|nr:HAMP domain-containing histidine kinase [Calditrichota bacterium]
MKKWRTLFHPVLVFVAAQIAWVSLLGLWIYWYISNYIIFNQVGDKLSPQLIQKSANVFALVSGLVLLVAILVGLYLTFIYLNKQLEITKLYDNFIANVTHELKSPLASIQLYLETLGLRDVPPAKRNEFIRLMIKDANRLEKLINSILDVTVLEKKKIAHNFHIYTADVTIKAILEQTREDSRLPESALVISGSAPCQCVLDQNAIKIVFDNLVDNAIKYSFDPVQIAVNLSCSAKDIIVTFSDQGIGIPVKARKKVFKKFHRIYGKNIPSVKGTGLGLYWVKEIIKYHGGQVSVSSKGQNKGSIFRIEIPIYQTSKRRYINQLLKLTRKREQQQVSENV